MRASDGAPVGEAAGLGSDPPKVGFWGAVPNWWPRAPPGVDCGRVLRRRVRGDFAPLLFLARQLPRTREGTGAAGLGRCVAGRLAGRR